MRFLQQFEMFAFNEIHGSMHTLPKGKLRIVHGVDTKVKGGRYVVRRVRCWLRPRSERCRLHSGLCATQPLAGVLNKSSTSPASRLCAALRRRAPGNERLHLIRRKWKRNHAQKTPIGGSRRVRYSASVRRTTAVLVGPDSRRRTARRPYRDVLWSPI